MQAVEDYMVTQQVLEHYAHLESFRGIQSDCIKIVEELKERLRGQFKSRDVRDLDSTLTIHIEILIVVL